MTDRPPKARSIRVSVSEWEWAHLSRDELATLIIVRIRKMQAGIKGRGPHGDD